MVRTRVLLTSLVAAYLEHQVTLLSYLLAVGATSDKTLPAEGTRIAGLATEPASWPDASAHGDGRVA